MIKKIDFRKKKYSLIDITQLKLILKAYETIDKTKIRPEYVIFVHGKKQSYFLDKESDEEIKRTGKLTITYD